METGRFQPAIEQERFGWAPDGAKGLSVCFVRAAYLANGVKQNPGDLTLKRSFSRLRLLAEHKT
ncbi:MAG TPA: hypothetical protein GX523_04230 [Desulfitobacterium dehalogenans]|uniref:Uncharacterized protein n=1 Tax=Desulfitobacterium dehalogenans TaxID=36854 RepID=A0A7C7D4H3_9FIRM|nr:hypothetical protein [Desulfitobacterium dehalogenans]